METTAYVNVWRHRDTGLLEAEGVYVTPEDAAQNLIDCGPTWRGLGYQYETTLTGSGTMQIDDLADQIEREAADEFFFQRQEARAYREAAL